MAPFPPCKGSPWKRTKGKAASCNNSTQRLYSGVEHSAAKKYKWERSIVKCRITDRGARLLGSECQFHQLKSYVMLGQVTNLSKLQISHLKTGLVTVPVYSVCLETEGASLFVKCLVGECWHIVRARAALWKIKQKLDRKCSSRCVDAKLEHRRVCIA